MTATDDTALMKALNNRLNEKDDYARQLEEAVRTWETLDASPQSLLDLNDTHLITETPGGVPWPSKPVAIPAMPLAAEILGVLPEAIVLLDVEGRVKFWSPAAEAIFGWSSSEVIGVPPPFVSGNYISEHQEIVASARHDSPICERIVSRRGKDGRARTLSLFAKATPSGNIALVFRAVEPAKIAAETTTPPNAKLETLGRMVMGVSHDFNNVLAAIVGSSDLLAERIALHSPDREWVEIIRIAGRHASGLTRRLLEFAKPSSETPTYSDVSAVVKDLAPLMKALVPHGVKLKMQLAPNLPMVYANNTVIEQVIMNLTTNAGQAMPRGGVLQIRTSAEVMDGTDYVVIALADSGNGMDDTTRARLFEPFFSTRGQGIGLGLATVREIVTEAKGRIDVDTIPGMGSVFRVFLPALPAPTPVLDGSGLTALVVDDDSVVRELMKRALESVGYDVSEAASGDEAILAAHWLHNAIDLVVTDVVMPSLGGRKLVERLRARKPDLAVVYVSGYRQVREETCPNTSFLAKPFTGRQLIAAIKTISK